MSGVGRRRERRSRRAQEGGTKCEGATGKGSAQPVLKSRVHRRTEERKDQGHARVHRLRLPNGAKSMAKRRPLLLLLPLPPAHGD